MEEIKQKAKTLNQASRWFYRTKTQTNGKHFITIDYILIYLGVFDNLEDAKPARIKRSNEAFAIYTNACEQINYPVALTTGANKFDRKVHILVLNGFLTNFQTKPFVNHIDNRKSNNNVYNLRWATHTENGRNQTIS